MEDLEFYRRLSEKIPGWTRNEEAAALAKITFAQPDNAVIVEIGAFFGSGSVLLARARKLQGSGKVHCIDPFDGSGDLFSVDHYRAIIAAYGARPLRNSFDQNIREAGLSDWVEVHQGSAERIARGWTMPIDLLFLDGDQSPTGARAAYEAWSPWLKQGGVIALHNSNPRQYAKGHDGHYQVSIKEILPPRFIDRILVGTTTFARKALNS